MTSKTIARTAVEPIAIYSSVDEDFRIVHPKNTRVVRFKDRHIEIGEASEAGFFKTDVKSTKAAVRKAIEVLSAMDHLTLIDGDGADWLIDLDSIAAVEIYPQAINANVKFAARGRLGRFEVNRDIAGVLVDQLKGKRAHLVLEAAGAAVAIRRDLILAVDQTTTYARFHVDNLDRDAVTLMTGKHAHMDNPAPAADATAWRAIAGLAKRRGFISLTSGLHEQIWLDPAQIAIVSLRKKTVVYDDAEMRVTMKGGATWFLDHKHGKETPAHQYRRVAAAKKRACPSFAKVDLGTLKLAYDPEMLLEAEFTGLNFPNATANLRLIYGPIDQTYTVATEAGVAAFCKDLSARGFIQVMKDSIYNVWGKPASYAAIIARNDMTSHDNDHYSSGYTGLELYYANCGGRRKADSFRGLQNGLVAAQALAATLAGDAFQLRTASGAIYFDLKSVEAAVFKSGQYGMVELALQTKFKTLKVIIARQDAGHLTVRLGEAGLTRIKGFSSRNYDLAYARPEAVRIAFADGGFQGEPHTWCLWFNHSDVEIEDRHAGVGIITKLLGETSMNAIKADSLQRYAKEMAKRQAEQQANRLQAA